MQSKNKNVCNELPSRYRRYCEFKRHLAGRSSRKVLPITESSRPHLREITKGVSDAQRIYTTSCAKTLKGLGGGQGAKTGLYAVKIKEATKKGYAEAIEGDSINLAVPNSKTRRGRVGKGVAQTLDTGMQQHTLQGTKIRRLTPTECERLQGFPDGWTEYGIDNIYHIRYNKYSNNINILDLCKQTTVKKLNSKNAQWKIVKEKKLPILVTASCTIKDGKEQEQQTLLREILKEIKNVNIVITKSEKLGQWECAINIIKCGGYMETPFMWKIKEVDPEAVDILETGQVNQFIELSWKNISEENLHQKKYHIISMVLRPIIESVIYTFAQGLNMQLSISNLNASSQNQLIMEVLSLKTESIVPISDSARYKTLGNAVTVNVIQEIMERLIK